MAVNTFQGMQSVGMCITPMKFPIFESFHSIPLSPTVALLSPLLSPLLLPLSPLLDAIYRARFILIRWIDRNQLKPQALLVLKRWESCRTCDLATICNIPH